MQAHKPHILILASWYPNLYTPFNGDFVQRIAEETSREYKVTVLHICNKQEAGKSELVVNKKTNDLEERVFYLEKKPWLMRYPFFLYSGSILLKQIKKERGKVDFCHVQVIWKMGLLAYLFKRKNNIPYFITEHWTGYLPQNNQLNKFGLKFLSRLVGRNAQGFITVSENLGTNIQKLGIAKTKPSVLHNIVRYAEPQPKDNTYKAFTFVHLSNFRDEQKNVSGIIRAFARSLNTNPNMKLLLGGANDTRVYEKQVNELNIPIQQISFLPEMSHERALATIAQADALICFSHYETFGITCAEALCMGVPVIYTPCGGPEEYIQKHMGIEVPLQDESALTQAIIALSNGTITFDKNRILTDARALFDNAQWLKKLKCIY